MTSYPSDMKPVPIPSAKVMDEIIRFAMCKIRCRQLMVMWFCLVNFYELEEWFESSQCCLPLSLSKMLDHRIIEKAMKS